MDDVALREARYGEYATQSAAICRSHIDTLSRPFSSSRRHASARIVGKSRYHKSARHVTEHAAARHAALPLRAIVTRCCDVHYIEPRRQRDDDIAPRTDMRHHYDIMPTLRLRGNIVRRDYQLPPHFLCSFRRLLDYRYTIINMRAIVIDDYHHTASSPTSERQRAARADNMEYFQNDSRE